MWLQSSSSLLSMCPAWISSASLFSCLYFSWVSFITFFNSSTLSAVNFRTMTSSTVSTTSPFSPLFRFGVSVVSRSSEYWEAQCFWENQSGGRPGSAKGLIALLTDTQFWSPLLITEDAKHSFSRMDQGSVGPVLSSLCSEKRKGLEATIQALVLSPKEKTKSLIKTSQPVRTK